MYIYIGEEEGVLLNISAKNDLNLKKFGCQLNFDNFLIYILLKKDLVWAKVPIFYTVKGEGLLYNIFAKG